MNVSVKVIIPRAFTGLMDVVGRPIFFGQKVIVKSELTDFHAIVGTALPRPDGEPGFCIPFGNGCLRWECDGEPAYEYLGIE